MPSPPTRKPYHHGDLRNTLVRTGVAMLREVSPDQLSLRELAKRAGVSHNAPYQHFEDREALVAAIAQEGFELLMDTVARALARSDAAPLARLRALRAYVRFARQHPSHFQVMFSAFKTREHPELSRAATRSRDQLLAVILEAQSAGVLVAGAPYAISRVFWTQLHGIATIANAGMLDATTPAALESVVDQAFEALLDGLRPRQSGAQY
jgi:AcrR family transcriptional regulator